MNNRLTHASVFVFVAAVLSPSFSVAQPATEAAPASSDTESDPSGQTPPLGESLDWLQDFGSTNPCQFDRFEDQITRTEGDLQRLRDDQLADRYERDSLEQIHRERAESAAAEISDPDRQLRVRRGIAIDYRDERDDYDRAIDARAEEILLAEADLEALRDQLGERRRRCEGSGLNGPRRVDVNVDRAGDVRAFTVHPDDEAEADAILDDWR